MDRHRFKPEESSSDNTDHVFGWENSKSKGLEKEIHIVDMTDGIKPTEAGAY